MASSDIEMLVAALAVDVRKMGRDLEKATGKFDGETRKMEKRCKAFSNKLNHQLSHISGVEELKRGLMGLTAAGVVGGLFAIVDKGLKAAAAIKEMSVVTGFGVERLQELRFIGTQTGLTFDKMDQALTFFNKTFGEYLNTGKGKLAAPFKQFGLDKDIASGKIRTAEQALDPYIAKVNAVGNASQRANLLADGFGRKMGPQMAEFAEAGAAKLEELKAQAHSLGIVLSEGTVEGAKEAKDKLEALFSVIEMQGVSAVAGLAPQIAELTQKIIDGMPSLILWVERWADWFGIVSMSPVTKVKADIADLENDITALEGKKKKRGWWSRFMLSDKDLQTLIDGEKEKAAQLKSGLNDTMEKAPGGKPFKLTVQGMHDFVYGKPKLHVPNPNAAADARAAESEAEREARMAARVQQIISSTGADALTAQAALAAATDRTTVEMLKGTTGYYAAVKKMTDDDLAHKLAALDAEKHAKLRHLATLDMTQLQHMEAYQNIYREFAAKSDAAKAESGATLYQETGSADLDSRIRDLKARMAALGMTSEVADRAEVSEMALAAATALEASGDKEGAAALREKLVAYLEWSKGLEKANIATTRAVSEADALRDALEGIASGNPFSNMVKQLEQAIIKLEIMDPMIEKIAGKRGTPLGGMLGGATSGTGIMQGGASGGGILGSLFGGGTLFDSAWSGISDLIPSFAVGTDSAPGGLAQLHKDEILNIPKGTQVIPRAPSLAMLRGGGNRAMTVHMGGNSVVVQGNADASVVSEVSRLLDARDQQLRKDFPKLVYKANRDYL